MKNLYDIEELNVTRLSNSKKVALDNELSNYGMYGFQVSFEDEEGQCTPEYATKIVLSEPESLSKKKQDEVLNILKQYNLIKENKTMKKSDLTKLIKEVILNEKMTMAPDKDEYVDDKDTYTADINDKKFKPNKGLDKIKVKLDAVQKSIDDKFQAYKTGKLDQADYIKFFKEKSKERTELEKKLHSLL